MVFTFIKGLFLGGKTSIFLYVIGGLIVTSISGYIYYLKNDNNSKQIEIKELLSNLAVTGSYLNDAIITNIDNKNEFKRYQTDTKNTFKMLTVQHKKELEQTVITTQILERINYDKEKHDGTAAVVLVNAFSGLQQLQTTNNKNNNKSKNSKTPSTR